MQTDAEQLRYPIGRFVFEGNSTEEQRRAWLGQIAAAPAELRRAVNGLSIGQLDTPYRPGGWTIRQVTHHLADSHVNSYVRFRLALTEHEPTIKPYDEAKWAELTDARSLPPDVSLALLDALHVRWVALLGSLGESDWQRRFQHPELGPVTLEKYLALYGWHGRHHVAHITSLRKRMGW